MFPNTRKIKLIKKKEFAIVALDLKYRTCVIYVATLSIDSGNKVYLLKKAQIVDWKIDEASTKVLSKYANFAYIFLLKLAIKLLSI